MSLEGKDLTVSYYGDIFVLRGVSLKAEKGRVTCIIGPNGAGKSTILRTIFGYLKPRLGRIFHDGSDITSLKPYDKLERGITYIPQEHTVFPNMSVEENLELGAWTFRHDHARARDVLEEIYARYPRLAERKKVKAGRLSGGEQRMLELARSLMTRPMTILVDEPSSGLAPKLATGVYREVVKLREEGKTILLVDQNVVQGMSVSDQVYVLELGRVKDQGRPEEMQERLREIVGSWVKV